MTWVLIGVALFLAIAALLRTAPEQMVLAMGALNASMPSGSRHWPAKD
jgi:hypothetical protein